MSAIYGNFFMIHDKHVAFPLCRFPPSWQAYEGNTLIYGGGDLNSGMLEYIWDILYISWFVEVGSLITNYAWLALLSIPFYAFWRLWWDLIKPWIFDEGIFAKTEVEESKTQRKKRVRAEKFGVGRRQ